MVITQLNYLCFNMKDVHITATPFPSKKNGKTSDSSHFAFMFHVYRGAESDFHVVIVDDNMSLRSMRRSYYQLAGECA